MMSIGTLYTSGNEHTEFLEGLVKHYKIDCLGVSSQRMPIPSDIPLAQLPAIRLNSGTLLTCGIPAVWLVLDNVPNKGGLFGSNSPSEIAQNLQWMQFFDDFVKHLESAFAYMKAAESPVPYGFWRSFDEMEEQLNIMQRHLTESTYLVGNSVSIADLYGAKVFPQALKRLFDKYFRAERPAVFQWFESVKTHPIFFGRLDDLEYAEDLEWIAAGYRSPEPDADYLARRFACLAPASPE